MTAPSKKLISFIPYDLGQNHRMDILKYVNQRRDDCRELDDNFISFLRGVFSDTGKIMEMYKDAMITAINRDEKSCSINVYDVLVPTYVSYVAKRHPHSIGEHLIAQDELMLEVFNEFKKRVIKAAQGVNLSIDLKYTYGDDYPNSLDILFEFEIIEC